MIENVLRAIGGVGVYDAISICLFMLVFSGVILRALRLKKPFVRAMSALPLEDDSSNPKGSDCHE